MSRRLSARWLSASVLGRRDVAVGDVAFAGLLGFLGALSALGLTGSNAQAWNAGAGAALAVLTMTTPVVLARRYPVPVAATLAVGAALNWALIGHLVRCGTGLPAVFYAAFVIGSRCTWRPALVGVTLLATNVACQSFSDPQLGPGVLVYMVPLTVAFGFAGRLVAGRNAAVARLRVQTAQLREQREENARLAVAADQTRIVGDLDGFLKDGVGRIAAAAAGGRNLLAAEPDEAEQAFVEIARAGRTTLTHMRDVVANLKDTAPTEPSPMLAQLDRLLAGATEAGTRLQVNGDPRLLPPGVELAGYRIVERLVVALDNDPAAQIDVTVVFGPAQLELIVAGPSSRRAAVRPTLAAVAQRAALHGGTVQTAVSGRLRTTAVRLPLAAGYV